MSTVVPPTPLDRLWDAFRKLVRAELPTLTYLGVYEYAVQKTDGTSAAPSKTVDCVPTDSTIPLPPLTAVPIRMPFGVTPPTGALCSVQFMNGDPTRPMVTGFTDPMTLLVFASGTLPAGRQGDMVAVTLAPATLALLAPQFANGGGPCAYTAAGPPLTLYGLISTGNPRVKQ